MNIHARKTLTRYSATRLAALIAKGELSSAEVVEAHIERIEETNASLNAVVVKLYDSALREAKEADRWRVGGHRLGPLHGLPITIKESIEVGGTPSTFGIAARKKKLSLHDDTYVAQLRAAGAIIVGKTNVAQCLIYYESDNPAYGRTNNPWSLKRTSGGSSGGEAAIIAAGGSPLGLGTDLGGSLRVPATFCGLASLKPTTGRTPDPGRYGVPIGQRAVVSQMGVLARHVEDVALGTQILNGVNSEPQLPLGDHRQVEVSTLRIGYYTHDGTLEVAPAVRRAVQQAADGLRRAGADVLEWTPPHVAEAVHLFFALLSGDGGRGFKQAVGSGPFDPRLKTLMNLARLPKPALGLGRKLLGSLGQSSLGDFLAHFGYTSVAQHWRLVEAQMEYQRRFANAMDRDGIDAILCPACALPAFTHGATNDLGVAGGYTILHNLLGYPAGVAPFTRVRAEEEVGRKPTRDRIEAAALKVEQGSAGLPVGVQVVARPWREHIVLAVMQSIEDQARVKPDYPAEGPM